MWPKMAAARSRQRGLVARLLDQLQTGGRLVVAIDELIALSGLTLTAVRRQLEHLSPRVVRLPGRPSACLIVSPEHRVRGAPPVAGWLDAYSHRIGGVSRVTQVIADLKTAMTVAGLRRALTAETQTSVKQASRLRAAIARLGKNGC